MDDIPISTQLAGLAVLLLLAGLFSMAETAMMAANRYRLRHLAQTGHGGARLALDMLAQTDKLLGVISLGNNLINAASAMLVGLITVHLFGEDKWALGIGTLLVTFAILVFAEITPKVIGAAHADRLAPIVAYVLKPLLTLTYPIVSFVNLFVSALLFLTRLKPKAGSESQRLSMEELRSMVLEAAHYIPSKHRSILLNIFDLERITVEDVMIPRHMLEAIDLEAPIEDILRQITTSYHTRLPVYRGELDRVVGILHVRRILDLMTHGELDHEQLEKRLVDPYFIPAGTGVYAQLQFFEENRQRIGLVVDEYGDIQGLLTVEDIIEELVGEFTTTLPSASELVWDENGSVLVEGGRSLRELNRKLGLDLPVDGPKTLNGLIIEHFQDIPETGVTFKLASVTIEVVQTQDRSVKAVRLSQSSA